MKKFLKTHRERQEFAEKCYQNGWTQKRVNGLSVEEFSNIITIVHGIGWRVEHVVEEASPSLEFPFGVVQLWYFYDVLDNHVGTIDEGGHGWYYGNAEEGEL